MAKDNTLIHRAQTGDEEAFADLMREHYAFVYAIVIRIVKNSHDAEEVVQDAFLNAYRGLTQLEDTTKFKSWLGEIAQNCGRNWLRKQRTDTVSIDEVSEQALQIEDSPDERLTQQEQRDLIRRTMETLPQKDREIAQAFYLDGASYDELTSTARAVIQRHCVSSVACEAATHQTVAIPSHWHLCYSHDGTQKDVFRRSNCHESWNSS